MSKRIFLDDNGAVQSDGSRCRMAEGSARRTVVATASDLADIISACRSDQAIALGSLKKDIAEPATITVPNRLASRPGAITRSREYIDYRPGTPAWALIDFDTKGIPATVAAAVEAAGGAWKALLSVAPGLERAERVSRQSTSAGLFHSGTGKQFSGSGGSHHYILVQDAADIERFLRDLHDRCWLHGLGWHLIGGAGQLLDRSLVDRMVGFGERLVFEGAPLLVPPVDQDLGQRNPEVHDGEAIDTGLVVPKLRPYEHDRVEEAKTASTQALAKPAAEIRVRQDRVLAEGVAARTGMPLVTAERLVKARHRGVLLPYLELDFDHLGVCSVTDVLLDPDRFVGQTLADPLEGADYGRGKAIVMKDEYGSLFVHSFAHGRGVYRLRHDARSAKAAVVNAPTGSEVDFAMAVLANSEMEADEIEDFIRAVSSKSGIGIQAIKKRVARERQEQRTKREIRPSESDDRIVLERPDRDGELTPTVSSLDEILASDDSEEPPMRDTGGNLVEVRTREPWKLHELTSDGSNASEGEVIKAPAEPILTQLTPTCVQFLLEKYVRLFTYRKDGSIRFVALPQPHTQGLMQFSTSTLPIVRVINTAPLVTLSGGLIDGVGLDRATGFFHRIDPVLRSCVPTTPPTDNDIAEAMTFLLDEWLVAVATDRVGKAIALMLALTLIERALLPERPAFFVTAGQRGGGKTTLIHMIATAVFGRKAAAAGWSTTEEERRKALFAYLKQGVGCLVWDNIPRGSSISCPHIEAALTSLETSDRILGVSRVETVTSTTVHIFTGNAILPRGDMASRSLIMTLNPDRPDPENRTFTHLDPIAWTEGSRAKILRALYTLLLAGASRPRENAIKTRFKTWYRLVAWSVEHAAALIGVRVDSAELFRLGEADDEEASAVSTALSTLHSAFGVGEFTSKQVVQHMEKERFDGWSPSPSSPVTDALAELLGKRLERPTALSIGKLFQKRLIGRPAFVGDGGEYATLVRSAGHNQNNYRIRLIGKSERPETA